MYTLRIHALARLCLFALLLSSAAALSWAQEVPGEFPTPLESASDDDSEPLLQVQRIELGIFGGFLGGDVWLDLPDITDPLLTSDTSASAILDFSEVSQPELQAPKKQFEGGWMLGGSATFYVGNNFGMQLIGSYASLDAVLTGHAPFDYTRFEVDRTTVSVLRGGGSMIYNLGREVKWPIRPYVFLGFGGVLNKFPNADDTSALFFQYGAGVSIPLVSSFRAEMGTNFTLYSYETDEVALDSTIQLPAAYVGLTWRYDVPVDDEESAR